MAAAAEEQRARAEWPSALIGRERRKSGRFGLSAF